MNFFKKIFGIQEQKNEDIENEDLKNESDLKENDEDIADDNDVEVIVHDIENDETFELIDDEIEEEVEVVDTTEIREKSIKEIVDDLEEIATKVEKNESNPIEAVEVMETFKRPVEDIGIFDVINSTESIEVLEPEAPTVIMPEPEEFEPKESIEDKENIEDTENFEDAEEDTLNEEDVDLENDETSEKIEKVGFFAKLKEGIKKTRESIFENINSVFNMFTTIDEELFEELEEALILADMGVDTSLQITNELRAKVKKKGITEVSDVKKALIEIISDILSKDDSELIITPPTVILVIGVNGAGKTTTIGKLAHNYISEGKSVTVAAADTFRAAAIEQLEVWAKRTGANFIRKEEGSDPASVVFDACKSAKAKKTDVLIIDTAGRLQNKKNLMEELKKIHKIITREFEDANKEVFLVLDSTTGQNAMQQAKLFNETADITGLILTKLDGTAKGGVIVSIKNELSVPVRFIGVGEKIDDLEPFDSKSFASALFE